MRPLSASIVALTVIFGALPLVAPSLSRAGPVPQVSGLETDVPANGHFAFLGLTNNGGGGRAANYVTLPGRSVAGGLLTVWSVDIFERPVPAGGTMAAYSGALNLIDCARRRVSRQRGLVYDSAGKRLTSFDSPKGWQTEAGSGPVLTQALDMICKNGISTPTLAGLAATRRDATRRLN